MNDATAQSLASALGDRYQLLRELGGGGMSRVFLAHETALDREVVAKVIAPELREGLSAERFARKVQMAARLQQANIVPVLTASNADGIAYYTMPYVDGQSLRDRLMRGPLPLGETLDVLRDVARALAYAHGHGIVHRDIKPENVLLSSGTAVVTDFGIAKALAASRSHGADTTLTQAGTSLGTPAYMAPEQAVGDEVDARADLYAWGVIAYELLTNVHPFASHATAQRLVVAHLTETPAPLRSLRPDVPAGVAALVMQCLEKDPGSRPRDAGELLARLSTVATPGEARDDERASPGGFRAGVRRGRRGIAMAVGSLAVATIAFFAYTRRAPDVAPLRTVVVVPFENLGDPADAYFAEGVSDEIAGQLARLPGLAVIGRDGVQRFRGSRRAPRDIARELGAAWVLSGSVRWARSASATGVDGTTRVRIVPALLNVATGRQEWGEPSDERLTDVFKVQAEVAERVASALSVTLGGVTRASLRRVESADPDARDAQMLGRYLLRARGLSNLRRAEEAFSRAIARDSSYARAWAGLAETLVLRPAYYDTSESVDALLARAEHAARRASALDGTLPEVQMALARTLTGQFRFRDALQSVDSAIVLDPNSTFAFLLAFQVRTALGQLTEAGEAARRAVALDALSALALNTRSVWFADVGVSDSSIRYAERAVAVDPTEGQWKRTLGIAYAVAGRYEEALQACRQGIGMGNLCDGVLAAMAGVPEKRARALEALGTLGRYPGVSGTPGFTALAYARLGMADSVFSRLTTAIERKDDVFTYLITNHAFAPYHADPRWDATVGAVRRR